METTTDKDYSIEEIAKIIIFHGRIIKDKVYKTIFNKKSFTLKEFF